jgi:hypothetical protein
MASPEQENKQMNKLKLPTIFEVSDEDCKQETWIPRNMEIGSLGDWFLHVDGNRKCISTIC